MASDTFCELPGSQQSRTQSLWNRFRRGMGCLVYGTASAICSSIAWLIAYIIWATERFQGWFQRLVDPYYPQSIEGKQPDLESGSSTDCLETFSEPVLVEDLSAVSPTGLREGHQPYPHELSIPSTLPSITSPQGMLHHNSEAPNKSFIRRTRLFLGHFIPKPSVECTESDSSFWQCRGLHGKSDRSVNQEEADHATLKRLVSEVHLAEIQTGSLKAFTASDGASLSTRNSGSVDMTNWNVIDFPFPSRRLNFWDCEEGLIRSRAMAPADCQRVQSHALQKKKSDDSFESTRRYIDAYDKFFCSQPDPRDLSVHIPEKLSAEPDPVIPAKVYSEVPAIPKQQAETPYEIKHVNRGLWKMVGF